MAGVLEFFYEVSTNGVANCSKDHEAPTEDLIININYLQNCDGIGIIFNTGTFFIFTAIIVVIYRECQFIQPIKKWIPESTILMMIGFAIGLITYVSENHNGTDDETRELEPENSPLFMPVEWLKLAYLPTVILNASYSLYHLQFFRQIRDITWMAFIGTIFNIVGTCMILKLLNYTADQPYKKSNSGEGIIVSWTEFFLLSSTLAAVDPVAVLNEFKEINTDTTIYYLLLGESTLNGGFAYSIFRGFEKMLHYKPQGVPVSPSTYPTETIVCLLFSFLTSPILAILFAIVNVIACSLVCRNSGIKLKFYLPYIVTGFVWMGFYIAEKMGFSAIIFTITCGLGQVRYTFPNMTYNGQNILKGMIRTNAAVLDTTIFALIGFNVGYFSSDNFIYMTYPILVLIILQVFRFVLIFGIFGLVNEWRQSKTRVPVEWQLVLYAGGLRGGLSYVMAIEAYRDNTEHHRYGQIFLGTVYKIIFLTVVLNGILIKPLIHLFKMAKEPNKLDNMAENVKLLTDVTGETLSAIVGGAERNNCGRWLGRWDDKLKKCLIKDHKTRIKLNKEDLAEELKVTYDWLESQTDDLPPVENKHITEVV